MGPAAIILALVALTASVMSFPGMFVAMGAAILAAGVGRIAWQRRASAGAARLAGAAGIAVATLALLVAVGRYVVTVVAVEHLASMVS